MMILMLGMLAFMLMAKMPYGEPMSSREVWFIVGLLFIALSKISSQLERIYDRTGKPKEGQ